MEDNRLIWIHSDLTDAYPIQEDGGKIIDVTIIERDNHTLLFHIVVNEQYYSIFKKIMKQDRYALQFIEHESLRDASIIKIKQSPHKPILNALDPRVWREPNEFYMGF